MTIKVPAWLIVLGLLIVFGPWLFTVLFFAATLALNAK